LQNYQVSTTIVAMKKWFRRLAALFVIVACSTGFAVTIAYANELQSTNYRFDESVLGGGGLIRSNSANYQASGSIGDTAIGNSASTNFQVQAGSKTTNDPTLSFSINTPNVSLGNFSAGTATTSTSTFGVIDYTSYGYAVQILGDPPTNGNHTINAMSTTDVSQTGIEQFGINLVANTDPVSVGANPDHGLFGVGSPSPNYGTSNQYRYVNGETIATAPKSSGLTTYTISYVVNVNSLTPGGEYKSNQQIVCTGTY
jgi:hypothetical protein